MDKYGCVGANVRALFKPPRGMRFITADFDSQELLLAAELGDAILEAYKRVGYRGSTPFSISCHIGEKENKTTPHWLLSLSAQIDYTLAKNIGYAVIYGQSVNGSVDYFLMANKDMSQSEALERATTTHNKQKGVRDRASGLYYNGAASPTYNNLNRLVASPDPRSLLSHQQMSKALSQAKGDFVTTKQNWFIQEAGSSMRDRLVVYSWYFMQRYNISGRLVMTVHDEALHCVVEHQAELMAYILQLSHLYITAWKTDRLNLDILPAGQSYFSSVEVDTRWRKSVTANPPSTPDMPDTVWEPGYSLNPSRLTALIESGALVI
jgi:DNA polymerase gamma 1